MLTISLDQLVELLEKAEEVDIPETAITEGGAGEATEMSERSKRLWPTTRPMVFWARRSSG
jgi:hypothetical protein